MKKLLLTIVFTGVGFLSLTAMAAGQVITLQPSGCFGYQRSCYNINNLDENGQLHDIDILSSTSYASVTIYLDGVRYSSLTGMGTGDGPYNATLTGPYGEQLQMHDLLFSHTRRYISGRGAHWVTTWKIVSGSLVAQ